MREKPGFPAHSCVSKEVSPKAGMRGWGGRDRTSEWGIKIRQDPEQYQRSF